MQETVQLSLNHVRNGGIPFSALVVDENGVVIGKGVNEVVDSCDPTAHAEVVAIREACRAIGTPDLRGKVLFASGEPCALCYMVARWAGITKIFVAADRDDAARFGFDYRWTYHFFQSGRPTASMKIEKLRTEGCAEPFERWIELNGGL
ncbi:nucleoside deaminase [Roseibium sp. SCP14]|uniref:nucleoside deaminase n=1 Tax=Roseibium sp. SCP14 TaxID=3141375 RepID=UPI003336C9ED